MHKLACWLLIISWIVLSAPPEVAGETLRVKAAIRSADSNLYISEALQFGAATFNSLFPAHTLRLDEFPVPDPHDTTTCPDLIGTMTGPADAFLDTTSDFYITHLSTILNVRTFAKITRLGYVRSVRSFRSPKQNHHANGPQPQTESKTGVCIIFDVLFSYCYYYAEILRQNGEVIIASGPSFPATVHRAKPPRLPRRRSVGSGGRRPRDSDQLDPHNCGIPQI